MHVELMVSPQAFCETVDMPQVSLSAEKKAQIGARVRLIRAVLGGASQFAFCQRLGVLPQTWNTYEAGRMPTAPVLDKLWTIHGVTGDYLRTGNVRGMPLELVERLETTEVPERRVNRKRVSGESAA